MGSTNAVKGFIPLTTKAYAAYAACKESLKQVLLNFIENND